MRNEISASFRKRLRTWTRRLALAVGATVVVGSLLHPPVVAPAAITFGLLLGALPLLRVGVWQPAPNARMIEENLPTASSERGSGILATIEIATTLALGAFVLATALIGWDFAAAGAAFVFCALAIFGGPIWLASVGEEEEAEHERATGEHRTNR